MDAEKVSAPAEISRTRARFADAPGVDWWLLIVTMERHGYTHSAIGAAIGCARATVERWKNGLGVEPRHEDGERLCALWRVVTGKPREELPRKVEQVLSAADFR